MAEQSIEKIIRRGCYILVGEKRRFFGDTQTEWSLLTKPDGVPFYISSYDAKYLREDEGLECVLKDKDGELWELPERPFHEKFKGYYARKEAEALERKHKSLEKQKARREQLRFSAVRV